MHIITEGPYSNGLAIPQAARALEKAAEEERISVRGSRQHLTDFESLPATYWKMGDLDVKAIIDSHPRCRTQDNRIVPGSVQYEDLEMPERQVRKCWPAPLRERLFPFQYKS
jgi:hypothetical protein